jgi:glycosyltransferase involved in cell wall biosynthesis
VTAWSGTEHFLLRTLKGQGNELLVLGKIGNRHRLVSKALRNLSNMLTGNGHYMVERTRPIANRLGLAVMAHLEKHPTDVLFSPSSIPLSAVVTERPMVFYTDATFKGLLALYPELAQYDPDRIAEAEHLERSAIQSARRIIYTSDWAARSAVEDYGADPGKVHVVPFGSNLPSRRGRTTIVRNIRARSRERCELLLVGVDWLRKGGDLALEVLQDLQRYGIQARLTVVGCSPPPGVQHPDMEVHPFLNKQNRKDLSRLLALYERSHFLIVPSMAECFGIVYAEASSMGVPSLARDSGGVSNAVVDGVNGRLFPYQATADQYAAHIAEHFSDPDLYEQIALAAFDHHDQKLSWDTVGHRIQDILLAATGNGHEADISR